jgi:HAD superfamily hydrolase (TIGR01490 family)
VSLAIFDLDNTLIAGDSDHSWGEFLVQKRLVDAEEYQLANDHFYEEYKNGTLDIYAFLRFSLAPLTRYSLSELADLHAEFMREFVEPMLLPKALALLASHRARGDYLLIITATNAFVTRPIAKRLQVDDMLATEPEVVNGRYTGNSVGTPCFQGGKVTRLKEWLGARGHAQAYDLSDSYFYSDSVNDVPLLEQVAHPVAVDPDSRLAAIALARGWPVISLRD